MGPLRLKAASSPMEAEVGFVLAIPLLEPETRFTSPQPVAGVIYVDSKAKGFFVDDGQLAVLVAMAQTFLDGLVSATQEDFGRVRNVPLSGVKKKAPPPKYIPKSVRGALEVVRTVAPPRAGKEFQFNFDYSDFTPIEASATATR
jgi:hypothetical protein